MKDIPTRSRDLVRARAHSRCERCGVPAPNGHWHHRRSRRVRDDHTHCPCNGAWLCGTCHRQVHTQPEADSKARRHGFLVSQWATEPGGVAVDTPWGVRLHSCEGTITLSGEGATT